MKQILVIGGGAAGVMAAIAAAENNAEVLILEKNAFIGKKLAITGKGRCNFTNASSINDFIKKVPGNGSFLYSSLHQFSPENAMDFFRSLGVETKIERGHRVFPVSDDSHEIVNALKKKLKELNVNIKYNTSVDKIQFEDNKIKGVIAGPEYYPADAVILATGGMNYPDTGSTGDGYSLAQSLGHSIIPPRPSLVPLVTSLTHG